MCERASREREPRERAGRVGESLAITEHEHGAALGVATVDVAAAVVAIAAAIVVVVFVVIVFVVAAAHAAGGGRDVADGRL